MAPKVGNSSLLNLLAQEDLKSNEIYYHRHCYNDMVRNCEKLETDEPIMGAKWKKTVVFNSIVSYILDVETENTDSSFAVRELTIQCMFNSYKYMGYKKRNTFYKKVSERFT